MDFRITGLRPELFAPLVGLDETALARRGARRVIADRQPGFPDRIELRDAAPGEPVLLVNYTHLPVATPYRSAYALYVLEGARERYDRINTIPVALRSRLMSLRAFDGEDMLRAADVAGGAELEALVRRLLADVQVRYLHAHYAKPGCFAARIERA